MIDKKTLEGLIARHERKVVEVGRNTENFGDLAYAFHQIFDELIVELRIKSGLLTFEQFLQDKLSYDNIKICKLSEKTFEVAINSGDLIDEAKTITYNINGTLFIVKPAISVVSSRILTAERSLKNAVEAYNRIKDQL